MKKKPPVFPATLTELVDMTSVRATCNRVHVLDGVAYATDGHRIHSCPTTMPDGTYTATGEPTSEPALSAVRQVMATEPEGTYEIQIEDWITALTEVLHFWPSSFEARVDMRDGSMVLLPPRAIAHDKVAEKRGYRFKPAFIAGVVPATCDALINARYLLDALVFTRARELKLEAGATIRLDGKWGHTAVVCLVRR